MKNQALFSLKDIGKKLKCPLLHFLFGALRVNLITDADEDGNTNTNANANANLYSDYDAGDIA